MLELSGEHNRAFVLSSVPDERAIGEVHLVGAEEGDGPARRVGVVVVEQTRARVNGGVVLHQNGPRLPTRVPHELGVRELEVSLP